MPFFDAQRLGAQESPIGDDGDAAQPTCCIDPDDGQFGKPPSAGTAEPLDSPDSLVEPPLA